MPEIESPETATETSPDEVKIRNLKADRTKLKTKVTNACKKLKESIEDNVANDNDLRLIETCMSEFNDVHAEYSCMIECCDDLKAYSVVNDLNLDDYHDGVHKVYRQAKSSYHVYANSKQVSFLKQKINVQSARLESICVNVESLVSKPDAISETVETYGREIEELSDLLLRMMSDLSSLDHSCDDLQNHITKLVVRADEAKRKCLSKQRLYMDGHSLNTGMTPHVTTSDVNVDSKVSRSVISDPSPSNKENFLANGKIGGSVLDHSGVLPSQFSRSTESQISQGDIFLKKTPLPEFSGERKDWPEFKSVWRELAESTISSRSVLAYELKRSLKGKAKEWVQNIYITKPEAYDLMWKRLSEFYDDVSACVQSALDGLARLKPLSDNDYKGLVKLVDSVESACSQLEELGQVDILSMRDIDRIAELLPSGLRMLWVRQYHQLDNQAKLKPLSHFVQFLYTERAAVARLAENNKKAATQSNFSHHHSDKFKGDTKGSSLCAFHKDGKSKHNTADCRDFQRLSLDQKYQTLKSVHACFNCFGLHRRDKCRSQVSCKVCGKLGHHYLLCKRSQATTLSETSESKLVDQCDTAAKEKTYVSSHQASDSDSGSLYAIHDVYVANCGKMATIFCDNGSNTTYITHRAASRLRAKNLGSYTLGVTTMGNIETRVRF
jgi:hypothetical protein